MDVKSEYIPFGEEDMYNYDTYQGLFDSSDGMELVADSSHGGPSEPMSIALLTGKEGQGEEVRNRNTNSKGKRKQEDGYESRSASYNLGGGSGDFSDDLDLPLRKKPNQRYSPQQLQELESLFKECPHLDQNRTLELGLERSQIKFWFQNKRTKVKVIYAKAVLVYSKRDENFILRRMNEKLKLENTWISEATRNHLYTSCSGPQIIADVSLEEHKLRIENACLQQEVDHVNDLVGILGQPIRRELDVKGNWFKKSSERSMYLALAVAAVDELVKMAQTDEPLWFKRSEDVRDVLNCEEYLRVTNPCMGSRPRGFVSEASRETGMVVINSLALVETLMDSNRWEEMFPCVVARGIMDEVISNGTDGTRDGALQLIHAELQVLSSLVPVREVKFLRYCKQHKEGVWAVVNVSVDSLSEHSAATTGNNCRRLPSGCIVQDMPNGYSKVTWVEHVEYDENVIHELYRPLIRAGMGFGAQRWVATLQRQYKCLAISNSSVVPVEGSLHSGVSITSDGRRSMLKLAERMTNKFFEGVYVSKADNWNKISANVNTGVRIMTCKSIDDPCVPRGLVLSASFSVWLPISPLKLFDFLRDERLRSEWDILSLGRPVQEMARIAKGQDCSNSVSLLYARAINTNQSSMLILQETSIDAAGSLVVYTPIDMPSMNMVMNGGDSSYVALLPSGFAIIPDGLAPVCYSKDLVPDMLNNEVDRAQKASGSLLTIAFQILVNNDPSSNVTDESVETVNNLISCTVQKIKAAFLLEN